MTYNKQLWNQNPSKCFHINKIQPLQQIKNKYKVWISGLIGFLNSFRNTLQIVDDKQEMLKFYSLIDWNSSLVEEYIEGPRSSRAPSKSARISFRGMHPLHGTGSGAQRAVG